MAYKSYNNIKRIQSNCYDKKNNFLLSCKAKQCVRNTISMQYNQLIQEMLGHITYDTKKRKTLINLSQSNELYIDGTVSQQVFHYMGWLNNIAMALCSSVEHGCLASIILLAICFDSLNSFNVAISTVVVFFSICHPLSILVRRPPQYLLSIMYVLFICCLC